MSAICWNQILWDKRHLNRAHLLGKLQTIPRFAFICIGIECALLYKMKWKGNISFHKPWIIPKNVQCTILNIHSLARNNLVFAVTLYFPTVINEEIQLAMPNNEWMKEFFWFIVYNNILWKKTSSHSYHYY